jgi:hypothetical protein
VTLTQYAKLTLHLVPNNVLTQPYPTSLGGYSNELSDLLFALSSCFLLPP